MIFSSYIKPHLNIISSFILHSLRTIIFILLAKLWLLIICRLATIWSNNLIKLTTATILKIILVKLLSSLFLNFCLTHRLLYWVTLFYFLALSAFIVCTSTNRKLIFITNICCIEIWAIIVTSTCILNYNFSFLHLLHHSIPSIYFWKNYFFIPQIEIRYNPFRIIFIKYSFLSNFIHFSFRKQYIYNLIWKVLVFRLLSHLIYQSQSLHFSLSLEILKFRVSLLIFLTKSSYNLPLFSYFIL